MKRNRDRIFLPNGNSCSPLTVHPSNWKTVKAETSKPWYISYRFYAASGESKQIGIRGMNHTKDLKTRQILTKRLIADELADLKQDGYNPILNTYVGEKSVDDYKIPPNAPFAKALDLAFKYFTGSENTKKDLKSSLKYIQKSTAALGFDTRPLNEIRRRHLLAILENCKNIKDQFSDNQFNHFRTALIMLYKVFERYEAIEVSIVPKIEPRNATVQPRKEIPPEDRKAINDRLKKVNYRFWLFVNSFFSSGARLTEMSRIQGKHINLRKQTVLYFVKKRKKYTWVERPIPDNALQFWEEAVKDCGPDQYLFSKELLPGDHPVDPNLYTRRWNRWVKVPYEEGANKYHPKKKAKRKPWMDYNLYDLKYTRTTILTDQLFEEALKKAEKAAAKANGHTSTRMNKAKYDLRNKSRKDELIRKADVSFV